MKDEPWSRYHSEILSKKLKRLSAPLKFIQFQRLLAQVARDFVAYCGDSRSFAIGQLATAQDTRSFISAANMATTIEASRQPWGWPQLLKAMAEPAPGKRVQKRSKDGKRRKVSKKTAMAAIEDYLTQVNEHPKDGEDELRVWNQTKVEQARELEMRELKAMGIECPEIRIWSKEEIVSQLDAKRLRADLGASIVRVRREMVSNGAVERAKKRSENRKMKQWESKNAEHSRKKSWSDTWRA